MKKIIFAIAISIAFLQCSEDEPTISYPDKNISFLTNMIFFDIEDKFEVNLNLQKIEQLTFTLYSYNVEDKKMDKIYDFGVLSVPFSIQKSTFGELKADTSIFVLRAEGEGLRRDSYIEYKSIFPKTLSYGKSYKGVEGKQLDDTVTITLNKSIEGIEWTVNRKINSSGNLVPVTTNDVANKPHVKTIYYKLANVNETELVGGNDTIIYEFTLSFNEQEVTKQYKEPVKVDALTKNITTTLTYLNNAFDQRMPFLLQEGGITLTKKDSSSTLFSIIEGKSYKYIDLLNINYQDSLQLFHLYKADSDLQIATLGDKDAQSSRLTFLPSDAAEFKKGNRIAAEKKYTEGTPETSISVQPVTSKYYAIKLMNKEMVKSRLNPKVDSLADVTYFGFLETITTSLGSGGDFGQVVLNLKCAPKRDYTKE